MEERRLGGGRRLEEGKMCQTDFPRHLEVSQATASCWSKIMKAKKRERSPKNKNPRQYIQVEPVVKRKTEAAVRSWRFGVWNSNGSLDVGASWPVDSKGIEVSYHRNYLNRLLHLLVISPQKPLPQAIEQERELVKACEGKIGQV